MLIFWILLSVFVSTCNFANCKLRNATEGSDWPSKATFSRCYWSNGSLFDVVIDILAIVVLIFVVVVVVVADSFGTVDQNPKKCYARFKTLSDC